MDSGAEKRVCCHHRMILLHLLAIAAVATVLGVVAVILDSMKLAVHSQHDPCSSVLTEALGYPLYLILTWAFLLFWEESRLCVYWVFLLFCVACLSRTFQEIHACYDGGDDLTAAMCLRGSVSFDAADCLRLCIRSQLPCAFSFACSLKLRGGCMLLRRAQGRRR